VAPVGLQCFGYGADGRLVIRKQLRGILICAAPQFVRIPPGSSAHTFTLIGANS
jgi:hypothetical protein